MQRTAPIPAAARGAVRGPKRLLALRGDDRLVELVRAGDDAAFEVLYERHVAGVLGFCRHMLGSQEEAEDAVQQAFLSAHGAMRRGSRQIVFKPWLYTIARNRCLSMLRARREQPAELPELSTAGLSEEVEQRADLRELVRDIQRLPEQQRAALVLSELGDLSHAEVAEVIGQEPRAVKGLVFRARAALAERREARTADCDEIRLELASATGGGLRRGRLRYHLESCPDCTAFLGEVRGQRKLLGLALPVVPTLALKDSIMGSAGIGAGSAGAVGVAASGGGAAGAGAAGATGAATAGAGAGAAGATAGAFLGGAAVKLAVAGAILAGGAGVATEVVLDGDEPPAEVPPAVRESAPGGAGEQAQPGTAGTPAARALERRRGARGAERRARGQQRARRRSGGRAAAGKARKRGLLERGAGRPDGAGQGKALGGDGSRRAPGAGPPPPDAGGQGTGGDRGSSGAGGTGDGVLPSRPPQTQAPVVTPPPAAGGGAPRGQSQGLVGEETYALPD